ncbi:MAG: sulfotransferase family 2 domain-containing protein [Phycisphaerales bacterium]|nr:sulfotransferase family 2 domain-containing protein [Phycisphaerales bacterium]
MSRATTDDAPLLIHLHVPKTAGTTLSRMLRLRLLRWPPSHWFDHTTVMGYYNVPWLEKRYALMRALPERRQRRVRFFGSHHFGYGVHEHLPSYRSPAYFTFLRDPLERAMSSYYFLRKEGRVPDGMSLPDFAHQPTPFRTFHFDNCQVRFLAGEHGDVVDVPFGACTTAMLDRACARLDEMFFVGIVEDFDASVCRFADRLGLRSMVYATSQQTKDRPQREDVDPATIDALRAMNELDQRLYDHAMALHRAAVASFGPSFPDRVARFRARNDRHAGTVGRLYDLLPKARRMMERLHLMPDGTKHAPS